MRAAERIRPEFPIRSAGWSLHPGVAPDCGDLRRPITGGASKQRRTAADPTITSGRAVEVDWAISLAGTFTLQAHAGWRGNPHMPRLRFSIEPTTLLLLIFRPTTVLRTSAQRPVDRE
jgi:hypothetical protein